MNFSLYSSKQNKLTIPNKSDTIIKRSDSTIPRFTKKMTIKVLVWNTYKGKKKGFDSDLNKLMEISDIALLQESIFSKEDLDKNIAFKNKDIVVAISFINKHQVPTGVCTISNVKHFKAKFIRSKVKEPILKTNKMALMTTYPIGFWKKLTVINLHGINFVGSKKFRIHMLQVYKELKTFGGPIIIGGDFNSWSSGRIKILKDIVNDHKLQEIIFSNDTRRIKFDKIFTKGISIEEAKILNNIHSSDHKPLYIQLSIN